MTAELDPISVAYTTRFRKVSTRYPHRVSQVYRDRLAALADTDAEVAAKVPAWEIAEGRPLTDWQAIGAAEGQQDQE